MFRREKTKMGYVLHDTVARVTDAVVGEAMEEIERTLSEGGREDQPVKESGRH